MSRTSDENEPELAPGTPEVLQAATRVLAGVALRSLDVLDSAVTLPQFRLLAVLADLGPVPLGRAARALGLDQSTVTRLADRMVTAGHVARGTDPAHRGVVTLALSPSGRKLVAAADNGQTGAGPDHGQARPGRPGRRHRRAGAAGRGRGR